MNKEFQELGKAINKLKQNIKEETGSNILIDLIFDTIDELIKVTVDNAEEEKPKSYPLGRDPRGKFCVVHNNDTRKYFAVLQEQFIREQDTAEFDIMPGNYTDINQARKRAEGLNNLNLLIDEIYRYSHVDKTDECEFRIGSTTIYIDYSGKFAFGKNLRMPSERIANQIADKIGMAVIESALMYGVC